MGCVYASLRAVHRLDLTTMRAAVGALLWVSATTTGRVSCTYRLLVQIEELHSHVERGCCGHCDGRLFRDHNRVGCPTDVERVRLEPMHCHRTIDRSCREKAGATKVWGKGGGSKG